MLLLKGGVPQAKQSNSIQGLAINKAHVDICKLGACNIREKSSIFSPIHASRMFTWALTYVSPAKKAVHIEIQRFWNHPNTYNVSHTKQYDSIVKEGTDHTVEYSKIWKQKSLKFTFLSKKIQKEIFKNIDAFYLKLKFKNTSGWKRIWLI